MPYKTVYNTIYSRRVNDIGGGESGAPIRDRNHYGTYTHAYQYNDIVKLCAVVTASGPKADATTYNNNRRQLARARFTPPPGHVTVLDHIIINKWY